MEACATGTYSSAPLLRVACCLLPCRYLHCILCLVLLGRQDIVEQAHCINLDTMAFEPAEAAQHQEVQADALIPCLRLSEQQRELVAAAMSLYYELLDSIHRERQEIDVQMTAAGQPRSSSSSGGGSRAAPGAAGASTSSSNSGQQMDSLQVQQEQLQVHQELTNRLNLLLHKEVCGRRPVLSQLGKGCDRRAWSCMPVRLVQGQARAGGLCLFLLLVVVAEYIPTRQARLARLRVPFLPPLFVYST